MSRVFNPEHRGFTHTAAAWYAESALRDEKDGPFRVVDRIHFGIYPPGGGTDGEMSMIWIELSGAPSPRLECFWDAWDVLETFDDVIEALGDLHRVRLTPAQFVEILTRCGFRDRTHRTYEESYPSTPTSGEPNGS